MWMFQPPRKLWTITQTAAVTNETVSGIFPVNPLHLNYSYLVGFINFKCTAKNNLTLNKLAVYGALGPAGAATPGGGFPNVAGDYEALAYTESNIGVGDGITRPMQINSRDNAGTVGNTDHNRITLPIVPNFLQLVYTTSAPGAGPTITIEVWGLFGGPMIQGYA